MPDIAAHGLTARPPTGWDGEIYQRAPWAPPALPGGRFAQSETPTPILHLANFPLPPTRGDYGGGAVELMGRGGIFISILEHPPEEGSSALFAGKGIPWPLSASDFSPSTMQRTIAGQAGHQSFFTHAGRAFCLYVVLGSYNTRAILVPEVNKALAGVDLG
jgi:hypothetical protein